MPEIPKMRKNMCFGAWGRFCMSNNLPICLPICKSSTNPVWSMTKVDRIYVPVNMALALFHKHLKTNRNIFERGIGKTGFVFNCIAYWYCLLASVIPLGITRAYCRSPVYAFQLVGGFGQPNRIDNLTAWAPLIDIGHLTAQIRPIQSYLADRLPEFRRSNHRRHIMGPQKIRKID